MWHIIETTEDYKCMIATNAKVIFLFAPMHGEWGYLNLLNKNPDYETSTKDENNCDVVFAIVDKDKFPDLYHQNGFAHVPALATYFMFNRVKTQEGAFFAPRYAIALLRLG